jgi:ABC-2 type transport system ATP-binding protein
VNKVIKIQTLVKKFDKRIAVNELNLEIKQGEIFGLLGPNGAGKTTTIRMLTMLTKPTSGDILINGLHIGRDEEKIKALIGVVPQHINLDQDLTVGENLELHGRLHHMSTSQRKTRTMELLDYVELSERIHDRVQALSGGMKRRLLIARALMHKPKILLLDEPTVALDPQVRRRLWDLIRRMHNDHITVLLTTHYIEEAENLCNRVAIMEKGKLIALDTPTSLCQHVGDYVVEWEGDAGRKYNFFTTREQAAEFAGTLDTTTMIRHSNLEDVFVELTGRKVIG